LIEETHVRIFCVAMLVMGSVVASFGRAGPREETVGRRAKMCEKLGPQSMLVLFAGEPKNRTGDGDYPFRQQSDFLYLTGLTQPGATLVLLPGNQSLRELLFLPERNPARETWTGHMYSNEEATAISGIEHVFPAASFSDLLDAIVARNQFGLIKYFKTDEYQALFKALDTDHAEVFLQIGGQPLSSDQLTREQRFAERIRTQLPGARVRDASQSLTELRLVKSAYELDLMQHAVDITVEAEKECARAVQAGLHENDFDGLIGLVYRRAGATWAFPSIVASGPNTTTLHYEDGTRELGSGELLLLDIGAEVDGYAADVTRTIPVSGKMSAEQRAIYDAVQRAQERGIAATKPGVTLSDVHTAALESVKQSLLSLGLITDAASNQYRMFFMHGTSHFVGLDVHDVGARNVPLKPGMVITVEPGIYVRADALENSPFAKDADFLAKVTPAFQRFKNIGVRLEDDVLVTETGCRVMSEQAPRNLDAIEALIREDPQLVRLRER
jgi:Xaa-Pro aminopeptidase